MIGNISCFVMGCNEPVIGQFMGHKGNCGRFYCAQHSSDTLCAECAKRKALDEEMERIRQKAEQVCQEYEKSAETLYSRVSQQGALPAILTSIGAFIIGLLMDRASGTGVTATLVCLN